MAQAPLSSTDRFEIFEQLVRHQYMIDRPFTKANADAYVDLFWPDGTFEVHDLRNVTFEGVSGFRQVYDYAHSVFPMSKWRHSVGSFAIDGAGDDASVEWAWVVDWREDHVGRVSTGTYTDRYQRRGGQWKCLTRISDVDANWPAELFQPFVDQERTAFAVSR